MITLQQILLFTNGTKMFLPRQGQMIINNLTIRNNYANLINNSAVIINGTSTINSLATNMTNLVYINDSLVSMKSGGGLLYETILETKAGIETSGVKLAGNIQSNNIGIYSMGSITATTTGIHSTGSINAVTGISSTGSITASVIGIISTGNITAQYGIYSGGNITAQYGIQSNGNIYSNYAGILSNGNIIVTGTSGIGVYVIKIITPSTSETSVNINQCSTGKITVAGETYYSGNPGCIA